MQPINVLSSTEADIIDAVTYTNTDKFLRSMLWEIGFTQEYTNPIYEDNYPIIDIVNSSIPTKRTIHIDVPFFAIQGWKEDSDIMMHLIPGVINPVDDLTKPLGWVLHSRHARYPMSNYNTSFG